MISQLNAVESTFHGPSRPPASLSEVARRKLEESTYFRARSKCIHIDERDGTLVLHGRLPSYYLKQVAQTTLGELDGVKRIDNRIEVFWPDTTTVSDYQ